MKILVLNAGSSSLKFDLFETHGEAIAGGEDKMLAHGLVDRLSSMSDALKRAFEQLAPALDGGEIEAVGNRVVHGGEVFQKSVLIDEHVEREIEGLSALAPLHNPHNLEAIRAARKHLPNAKQVAVFDTAFHCTLPPKAYAYALPYECLENKKIRRYGFHGISHRYVSWRFAQWHDKKRSDFRMITCHLGNGCSICAIDRGRSVDISMGFTPLEGLVMGTRSGDVDAGAILYLIANEGMQANEVLQLLNSQSGLKGLSGVSNDMRDVIAAADKGDARAQLAIDVFCYRAKKYIGAYLAAMGGADALIFTGGIGENSAEIRARICEGLAELGIELDPSLNAAAGNGDRRIGESRVEGWVIPTNEELLIARDTWRCIHGVPHD